MCVPQEKTKGCSVLTATSFWGSLSCPSAEKKENDGCIDHSFLKKQPSLHVILTAPNEMNREKKKKSFVLFLHDTGKLKEETEEAAG